MNRYFFDLVEDGIEYEDEEGQDWPNSSAARASAIQSIRGILSAAVLEGRLTLRGSLRIRDAKGSKVMTVPFGEALDIQL